MNMHHYEVVIVGGSFAGISAALTLGRSLRKILIIDSGLPCNRYTPHSHNFITQDGVPPAVIKANALEQVLAYKTVTSVNDEVISITKAGDGFEIETASGAQYHAAKLIFATGVKDLFPSIDGFEACWGKTVLHCPYCHGYEVSNTPIGVMANGDIGFEFCKLVYQWSKQLVLFTDGFSTLTEEQVKILKEKRVNIYEAPIASLMHDNGILQQVYLQDGNYYKVNALFARLPFEQHCSIPANLGCTINEQGFIQVDAFQKTSIKGIYAIGDCVTMFRTVSNAVAMGTLAGAMVNKELVDETFELK
jgi:thioredoxin reductase